jgi:PD-(D/E)XK nuclease superfamily
MTLPHSTKAHGHNMDTITEPKQFFWSYSRLKAFEDCPRRYHETQVKKDAWPEEKSELLLFGDAVHKALADALKFGTVLPTQFRLYSHWIDKIKRTPGELLVEDQCQLACTREFTPTTWFAKNVWLRCVADAVKLDPPVALLVDWKSGKSANCDPVQLTLASLMLLIHFPQLHCVRSDFIWLQEDHQTTQVITRKQAPDHWMELLPRVKRLQQAVQDEHFPPTPGRYCRRYCPVKSCEYYGT